LSTDTYTTAPVLEGGLAIAIGTLYFTGEGGLARHPTYGPYVLVGVGLLVMAVGYAAAIRLARGRPSRDLGEARACAILGAPLLALSAFWLRPHFAPAAALSRRARGARGSSPAPRGASTSST
jgi:hypothetical protein